jgi:hypothetical protein
MLMQPRAETVRPVEPRGRVGSLGWGAGCGIRSGVRADGGRDLWPREGRREGGSNAVMSVSALFWYGGFGGHVLLLTAAA